MPILHPSLLTFPKTLKKFNSTHLGISPLPKHRMGKKKMKLLPSLFKNRAEQGQKYPWQWRQSCTQPKTQSFRSRHEMFNPVFFDSIDGIETSESWITKSSKSPSFSTGTDNFCSKEVENVVRGLKSSKRLFFEPGGDTSSIMGKSKCHPSGSQVCRHDVRWVASERLSTTRVTNGFPFKESVVMSFDSDDPYVDFRRSMEEMVETHGLKDWEYLGELLGWYLKFNGRSNHGLIVGAFVDMLVGVGLAGGGGSCSDSASYSSVVSSFLSSPVPLCENESGEEGKIVML